MKAKILIVEDESIEAMSFEQTLKSFGYDVVGVALTGEDALKSVSKFRPDLVLMDIVLKGELDGIETATLINDKFNLPIVYMTAHPEESVINRAKLTLPYGYIIKPVNRSELKSTIELALYKYKMENKLKRSEERFRAVAESAIDAIVTTDVNGKVLFCNDSLRSIFGYKTGEIIGKNLTVLMPERFKKDYIQGLKNFKTSGEHSRVGKTLKTIGQKKDGTEFPFEMSLAAWKSGKKTFFTSIIRDITEREKAENQIVKSLQEKEILLKEIHHRVKNNLQIISSLLDLQETYVQENETAVNVLRESQNRVLSMAMIHEMLYQSKDLSNINFSDYLKNLVTSLFHTYGVENRINVVTSVDNCFLNVETSVPLGLIISELVSNSLKYAFPDKRYGEISISIEHEGNDFELIINDDGIGFPEDINFKKVDSSLGLQLVNSLVNQLDGTIELDRSHGTKFIIKFKELKYSERV